MRDVYSRSVQKIIKYIKTGITEETSLPRNVALLATSGKISDILQRRVAVTFAFT